MNISLDNNDRTTSHLNFEVGGGVEGDYHAYTVILPQKFIVVNSASRAIAINCIIVLDSKCNNIGP